MSDLDERLAALSPEKRRLLELRIARDRKSNSDINTIPRRTPGKRHPLSFAQECLWVQQQLQPDISLGNTARTFRIHGAANVVALQQAMDAVVARHEILRTAIVPEGCRHVAMIQEPRPCQFTLQDVSCFHKGNRVAKAKQIIEREIRLPFDLDSCLMLRGMLVKMGETEYILTLVMHQAVSDLWSWRLLYRELKHFYLAFSQKTPAELPELPIQYADFAVWQREWVKTPAAVAQIESWRRQIGGYLPVLSLPVACQRSAKRTSQSDFVVLGLSRDIGAELDNFSRRENTTSFTVMLAAFQFLLFRYTGQEDILVGSPVAGRTHVETERLIGHFANLLAIRGDLSGNPTFRKFLQRTYKTVLEAQSRQDVPFDYLVDALKIRRIRGRHPVFDVIFNFLNVPPSSLEIGDNRVEMMNVGNDTSIFDLVLYAIKNNGEMTVAMAYNVALFVEKTIAEMMECFRFLLAAVIADPERRLKSPLPNKFERIIAHKLSSMQRMSLQEEIRVNYVAPRTPCESALAEIWTEVLWLECLPGIHDNFFDLGGNSLAAVRLVAEIEKKFARQLPLYTLSRLGTIAELAAVLENTDGTSDKSPAKTRLEPEIHRKLFTYMAGWEGRRVTPDSLLVGMNTDGTKLPLFWCFQEYRELSQLAKHLGQDQPVYGLRSGHLVMEKTPENIEALAAHYLQEIRAVYGGTYLLGGNCQGGIIAQAIAHQLQNRGQTVSLLCHLDVYGQKPYNGRIALLFGRDSAYNPYQNDRFADTIWRSIYPLGFSVAIIPCDHGHYFDDGNIAITAKKIQNAMLHALAKKSPRFPEEKSSRRSGNCPRCRYPYSGKFMIWRRTHRCERCGFAWRS